jgi:hypothetical protein
VAAARPLRVEVTVEVSGYGAEPRCFHRAERAREFPLSEAIG